MLEKRQIPNFLTAARLLAAPLFVLCYFILPPTSGAVAALVLFVLASLTDWADGFLARRWKVESAWGQCFDPIADKVLAVTALFVVVWQDGTVLLPSVLIAVREITVSGLREHLAKKHIQLPVTPLGRIKTAVQMIAISIFILIPALDHEIALTLLDGPALVLMWGAALLTVITGVDYLKKTLPQFKKADSA